MLKNLYFLLFFILVGDLYAQTGLPQLKISSKRIDFMTTNYLETKSREIVFKNVGDTVLTIYHIDSLKPPFYGQFHYPDTLKKDDSVRYYIAYKPKIAARDSQRVILRADTRLSHSIGLLFDISYSMRYDMPNDPGVSRLEAARIAGRQFINSMINTKDVKDEAAVFHFWEGFRVEQDFTTDKQKLIDALPRRFGSATAFYDGCAKSVYEMRDRPYVKVLIALTDGEDRDSWQYTPSSLVNLANRFNVKIFIVGIGSNRFAASLRQIAEGTGGKYFNAMTTSELNNIYYRIFNELSKNVTLYFDLLGNMPQPQLVLECPTDTIQHLPMDTLVYDVFLRSVNSEAAQGKKYELVLSFNRTLLYPLDDDFKYNDDGTVSFFGSVDSNLYTSPLKSIKFCTLVGDEQCTDIRLEKIIWDDTFYGELTSSDLCDICVYSCARDLRQIQLVGKNELKQNTPNPFNNTSKIDFVIENPGHYIIEVYDLFGNSVMILLDKYLPEGAYTVVFDRTGIPSGTYFYSLFSPNRRQTKRMIIVE